MDFCTEGNIRRQFQFRVSWLLGRWNGLLRDILFRRGADDRISDRGSLNEVQVCPSATLSHGGSSAYQVVPGRNPADLFMRQDGNIDSDLSRDASISGQFVQQWKLHASALDSTLKVIADSKLRRHSLRNISFELTDVQVGGAALVFK